MLTLEMQKAERGRENREGEGEVLFWVVSPGHCKTAFNGFKGSRDPMEGAEVVVRLIDGEKDAAWGKGGFWEWEGGSMKVVPW